MLKENQNIPRQSEIHLFGKKFQSCMIEIKKFRTKSLEAFTNVGEKKPPFGKGLSHSQNKPHGRGCYYYARKPGNRDQSNKYVRFQSAFQNNSGSKFQYGQYLQHKVNTCLEYQKEVPFSNNSNHIPLASMTLIHPVVRKLFTKEMPNLSL